MTAQADPYVRAHYRSVLAIRNNALLGVWLRLKVQADAFHPAPAPLPRDVDDDEAGLAVKEGMIVLTEDGSAFTMPELIEERAQQSEIGRNAAAHRWPARASEGIPPAMRPHANGEVPDADPMLSAPLRSAPLRSSPTRDATGQKTERSTTGLPFPKPK